MLRRNHNRSQSIPVDSILIGADYDSMRKCIVMRFYDPTTKRIYYWYDHTGHKPYCITDATPRTLYKYRQVHELISDVEVVEKYDAIQDKVVKVTKVMADDPLKIGSRREDSIRNLIPALTGKSVWESSIKYYECFLYDTGLNIGMPYYSLNGRLYPKVDLDVADEEFIIRLLEHPFPKLKRMALDIEVLNHAPDVIPNWNNPVDPVICASVVTSDGKKKVLMFMRDGVNLGTRAPTFDWKSTVELFTREEHLLTRLFKLIKEYPFVVTFNGDAFDLAYLSRRAYRLGFSVNDVPIYVVKKRDGTIRASHIKRGIHIDLYRFFKIPSIKNYAFKAKYKFFGLDPIAKALLDRGKIEVGLFNELTYVELAEYCLNDSELTYDLTSFDNEIVMNLMVILGRLCNIPIEELNRRNISTWLKSFFYNIHRKKDILIPSNENLMDKGTFDTTAIIEGKKYKGAIVIEAPNGIYFNEMVMDFLSLYPSIYKVRNLGYATVNCKHPECQENKVPETSHWVCTKRKALEGYWIGIIRDQRKNKYKKWSKDKTKSKRDQQRYSVIEQSLKVIMNASYGVFGDEKFNLYCPSVPESITAYSREAITKTIDKAIELGIKVDYGDTDSLFMRNPTKDQINKLIEWASDELDLELEVDKVYRYVIFSGRKKNYLGVLNDGTLDTKGLTGKKKQTPPIVSKCFYSVCDELKKVYKEEDFFSAKIEIEKIIRDTYVRLKRREWEIEELIFSVTMSKDISEYGKEKTEHDVMGREIKTTVGLPQHVVAAKILRQVTGRKVEKGTNIKMVKTKTKKKKTRKKSRGYEEKLPSAKPVQVVKTKSEVDVEKYVEFLEETMAQITDTLEIPFEKIKGEIKLDQFL